MYQFKVKLDNEKCRVFFIEAREVGSFDYSALLDRVRSFSSQLRSVDKRQLRLYYLDDEDTFVHLSEDAGSLVEIYRCSAAVKNADFKRITVKVEESSSPVSVPLTHYGKRTFPINCHAVDTSPTSLPSKQEKERKSMKSNAVRSLSTNFDQGKISKSCVATPKTADVIESKLFQSPLENYLEKQRDKINNVRAEERQVRETLEECQSVIKKDKSLNAGHVDGPMCGNCHQRQGHIKLNCPYPKCETVFHCGDIAKHAEQKSRMKQVERRHKELLKNTATLENDLKVKEASAASIQSRYVYKVRKMLIESDPSRYLSIGAGGKYVENWFQLNKDARKLQSILRGNVPTSGTNIRHLLENSTDDGLNRSVLDTGKTGVRNPYRNLWEQKGVQWPKPKESSTSSSTCTKTSSSLASCSSHSLNHDKFPSIDEPSSLCDEYLLSLGIKESLKTTGTTKANLVDIDQETEENQVQNTDPELDVSITNSIPVLGQSFENAGISNDPINAESGLNVLANICNDILHGEESIDDRYIAEEENASVLDEFF